MSVKTEIIGKHIDDKLAFLLEKVAQGTATFIQAIRDSSPDHHHIGFKAFTLKTNSKQEADAVFDIVVVAAATEMKTHARDLITQYTFSTCVQEGEGEYCLLMECTKEAPPSQEIIESETIKEEEVLATVKRSEDPPTLPHASAISAHREPIAVLEG